MENSDTEKQKDMQTGVERAIRTERTHKEEVASDSEEEEERDGEEREDSGQVSESEEDNNQQEGGRQEEEEEVEEESGSEEEKEDDSEDERDSSEQDEAQDGEEEERDEEEEEEEEEEDDEEEEEEREVVSGPERSISVTDYPLPADAIRNALLVRPEITQGLPVSDKAAVYLAAVMEYLCEDLLDLAGGVSTAERPGADRIHVITMEQMAHAVAHDPEQYQLACNLSQTAVGERRGSRPVKTLLDCDADVLAHVLCDAFEKASRFVEATHEFRRQFAMYFKTPLYGSDVEVDSEAGEDEREDDTGGETEKEKEKESEKARGHDHERDKAYEKEKERETVKQKEEGATAEKKEPEPEEYQTDNGVGALYCPLIPSSGLHFATTSSSSSSSCSSPYYSSSSDRFTHLFRYFSITNDEEDTAYIPDSDADVMSIHETTYTTTYRVVTPPRLMHTATREITLASGLPAPVVNIITDYSKHEAEGTTIIAQYSTGVKIEADEHITQQVFVVKEKQYGRSLLAIIRGHRDIANRPDTVEKIWENSEGGFVQLMRKLGLRKEDTVPLLCMLFSPHIAPEDTEWILEDSHRVSVFVH